MKTFITTLLLFWVNYNFSQTKIDTLKIEKLLNKHSNEYKSSLNTDIINAIKAIDRKFIEVTDTLYRFKTKNHTFFQNITTQIKYLVPAKRALKMTASNLEKYQDSYSLVTFKNDTIKFLENKLGLEYRNPYPNSMFPIDSMVISLENIKTDHIHFNTALVNKKISKVAKKLNLIEQNEFFNYIKRNFTHFSEEDKIVLLQVLELNILH